MPSIHSKDEILLILDQMLLFDDSSTFQGILGLVHHLQWASLEIKLEVSRRIMTFLFTRPDVPGSFAKQIGWQDCLTKLLVKKMLNPDPNSDQMELDISNSFEVLDLDQDPGNPQLMSPSHYIDKATTTAKAYLPTHAGEAVGYIGSTVGNVANKATKRVSDNVTYAKDLASETVSNTVLSARAWSHPLMRRSPVE